ncbi:MAG: hypothetical protein CL940_07650 [Deltaproteobacteria bacterium]|nr:hypothetical protein [Deltaproteobacteria bacterium]
MKKNKVLNRLLDGRPSVTQRRLFFGAARRGDVTVISRPGETWDPKSNSSDRRRDQNEDEPEKATSALPKEQGEPS